MSINGQFSLVKQPVQCDQIEHFLKDLGGNFFNEAKLFDNFSGFFVIVTFKVKTDNLCKNGLLFIPTSGRTDYATLIVKFYYKENAVIVSFFRPDR